MSTALYDKLWAIFRYGIQVRGQPGPDYFQGLREWRNTVPEELAGRAATLKGSVLNHFDTEALHATINECGQLVREGTIKRVDELPTADQCWDMLREKREYHYNSERKHWYTDPSNIRESDYTMAGNVLPTFHGQYHASHSLLKPEIGRRVARMHGTTKARWERDARVFWSPR